jgi:recombination protein RecR
VYEGIVQDLIDELGRLPGVGPKSAQRIAFHLLAAEPADVRRLAEVLQEVKAKVRFCRICGNVAESDECRVCLDPRRDLTVICVVEEPKDVVAVERTRLVKPMGLTVSRLASGLPVGGDLEYADEVTLGRAFEGRRSLEV